MLHYVTLCYIKQHNDTLHFITSANMKWCCLQRSAVYFTRQIWKAPQCLTNRKQISDNVNNVICWSVNMNFWDVFCFVFCFIVCFSCSTNGKARNVLVILGKLYTVRSTVRCMQENMKSSGIIRVLYWCMLLFLTNQVIKHWSNMWFI